MITDNKSHQILLQYAQDIKNKKALFEKISSGKDFDIFKHQKIQRLELAIMRGQSEPHYHTQDTFFCFVEDAILTLGGLDGEGNGHVSDFIAKAFQVYPIGSYVLHAAAPIERGTEVILLIYTPSGDRPRKSEYPDDTFKPKRLEWSNNLF